MSEIITQPRDTKISLAEQAKLEQEQPGILSRALHGITNKLGITHDQEHVADITTPAAEGVATYPFTEVEEARLLHTLESQHIGAPGYRVTEKMSVSKTGGGVPDVRIDNKHRNPETGKVDMYSPGAMNKAMGAGQDIKGHLVEHATFLKDNTKENYEEKKVQRELENPDEPAMTQLVKEHLVDAPKAMGSSAAEMMRSDLDVVAGIASSGYEKLKDVLGLGKHATQEVAGSAANMARETAASAADMARDAGHSIAETTGSAYDKAADVARSAKDTIYGTAWSAEQKVENVADRMMDTVSSGVEKAEDVAKSAYDYTADTARSAAHTTADTARAAADAAKSAYDYTADTARSAAHTTADTARAAADAAKSAYDYTADSALSAAQTTADTARSAADMTADAARSAYDYTKDSVKSAYDTTASATRRAVDTTEDAAKGAYDATARTAHSAYDKTADLAHSATDTARSALGKTEDAAKSVAYKTEDVAKGAYDSAAGAMHTAYDKTADAANFAADLAKSAKDRTEDAARYAYDATADTTKSALGSAEESARSAYETAGEGTRGGLHYLKDTLSSMVHGVTDTARSATDYVKDSIYGGDTQEPASVMGERLATKLKSDEEEGRKLTAEAVSGRDLSNVPGYRTQVKVSEDYTVKSKPTASELASPSPNQRKVADVAGSQWSSIDKPGEGGMFSDLGKKVGEMLGGGKINAVQTAGEMEVEALRHKSSQAQTSGTEPGRTKTAWTPQDRVIIHKTADEARPH